MSLFIMNNNFKLNDVYNFSNKYIHEIHNGIEQFYHNNKKNNKTKMTKREKIFNKKIKIYEEMFLHNNLKYYECVFLQDFIIAKINFNICVICEDIRFFNDYDVFKKWLFMSGHFSSSSSGCSCDQCNEKKIQEYSLKFNMEITKEQILKDLDEILDLQS